MKGRQLLHKRLIVGIRNEKLSSFWHHHWVGDGPLYTLIDMDVPKLKTRWFVSQILRNGKWHINDIDHLITCKLKLKFCHSSFSGFGYITFIR